MRYAGIILLMGAGSALGFYKAYELKRRVQEIILLQNAFRLLETEIYHTRTPVPLAVDRVSCRLPNVMRQFFEQVRDSMAKERLPLYQAWEQAMMDLERQSALCQDELDAIHSFGQSLGTGDAEEQLKHFLLLQQRLQFALDQAERNCAQNVRIWQYMGVCGSMAIALLLC